MCLSCKVPVHLGHRISVFRASLCRTLPYRFLPPLSGVGRASLSIGSIVVPRRISPGIAGHDLRSLKF